MGQIVQITLPCGRIVTIDAEDAVRLADYSLVSDVRKHTVYVRCWYSEGEKRKYHYLHHIIAGHRKTDHENGNGLDNRRKNLRPCDDSQNSCNASKKRDHKNFKGTYFETQRQKWRARLRINGSTIDGGFFQTEIEAARAYDELAREHHGAFARLNFS